MSDSQLFIDSLRMTLAFYDRMSADQRKETCNRIPSLFPSVTNIIDTTTPPVKSSRKNKNNKSVTPKKERAYKVSAYAVFVKEYFAKHKQQGDDCTKSIGMVSQAWKQLTSEEREPYRNTAAKLIAAAAVVADSTVTSDNSEQSAVILN